VIGSLFFITQLFQLGMGYSPLQAGLRILVWMAMPMVVAPIAGALADRIGNRPFMVVGLAMQAIGAASRPAARVGHRNDATYSASAAGKQPTAELCRTLWQNAPCSETGSGNRIRAARRFPARRGI
jgi:MFS family permease